MTTYENNTAWLAYARTRLFLNEVEKNACQHAFLAGRTPHPRGDDREAFSSLYGLHAKECYWLAFQRGIAHADSGTDPTEITHVADASIIRCRFCGCDVDFCAAVGCAKCKPAAQALIDAVRKPTTVRASDGAEYALGVPHLLPVPRGVASREIDVYFNYAGGPGWLSEQTPMDTHWLALALPPVPTELPQKPEPRKEGDAPCPTRLETLQVGSPAALDESEPFQTRQFFSVDATNRLV